jgi:hemoglobin
MVHFQSGRIIRFLHPAGRRLMDALKLLILIPIMMLGACANRSAQPSLFLELGGIPGIRQVVDLTLTAVEEDERIVDLFDGVDLELLRSLVVEQICDAAGGHCTYSGRSMQETHAGLAITDEEFDIFVQHLVAAMNQAQVPEDAQSRLAAVLVPMRTDIVGQ